jgi:hypothetical protein
MTRPRKPFGSNHPGRLAATMMKVLAAEMSDPARLRRGKQYAKDGSVLDIVIDPVTVTCEIQGSRSTPYIAVVAVKPGDGMPLRRDISFTCTCPDDGNWEGLACKHVVATLFTLSDELLLEPELLDLWRSRTEPYDAEDDHRLDVDDDDVEFEQERGRQGGWAGDGSRRRERRHLRLVGGPDDQPARPARTPPSDPLAELLRVPDGTALPDIGDIERIEPQLPKSRELATVLRDALGNLRIDWD